MKIALHNELPAEAQIQQLIQSVSMAESAEPGSIAYEASGKGGGPVIAAYDEDDRLVALGRLIDGYAGTRQFQFTVLPDYKERDIDKYMRKLMML